ncbi:hypothetical protein JZ751_011964 [Albula glossodonta]|uniref:Haloacid dehalogenase-like hydrolase domain-containing protein 2 n=1 Tax=Albula glossodonta TaxID=121402 RepID=A0A8T2PR54_9TELE|nr:hypothetical protein JZ751_011964 [Albula glossodonta]
MAMRHALKAVLIDLSGTLHIEDTVVPGAQEALSRLRQAPVAVKFVTNTTKECKRTLLERLHRLDFSIQEKEIFTSLTAARGLVELRNMRPLLLLEDSALEDFAVHKARYYKRKDGLALGPGPFVTGLEYATDTQAIVVGKPEKTFFLEALRDLNCKPEEAIMIGDDVRDDVGGAQNTGLRGILVKTGKYRAGDEDKISPSPHVTCDSFPKAVDYIFEHLI